MKKNVKLLLACAVLLMLVTTVVAAYYIWSNIVTVTVIETVNHLYQPSDIYLGQNITFNGYVNYMNGTPINGITVLLYFENGTLVSGATVGITDTLGNYTIQWNATEANTYNFKTRAEIP